MAAPATKFEAMRRSTRVRAEIPVRLRSTDPAHPFDILTRTLIVNAQGCGLHVPNDLPIGTPVELAIEDQVVTGRILNSTAVDPEKGAWVAGIQLDKSGNVWALTNPPADWTAPAPAPAPAPTPAVTAPHPFARPTVVKVAVSAGSPASTLAAKPVAASAPSPLDLSETRAKLDAMTGEIAGHLRTRASADWEAWRTQAETALRQLQQELANDLTARVGNRHDELKKAMDSLAEMVTLAEQRRSELEASSTTASSSQAREQDVRAATDQMSAQWLRDSEEAMGGLRARVEELVARHEAELDARLAQRQIDIVKQVEAGSEKFDRLLAAADRALEQMEGWEKRSADSNAQLLRAAEAALEDIDKRRASAESAVQSAGAASVEKLNTALAAGEQQLETKIQQLSWEYDAQAEAAGQKLATRLSEGLDQLRKSIEEHQAALAAASQSQRDAIAGGIREQLQAESDRHLAALRDESARQAGALRQQVDEYIRLHGSHVGEGHQKVAVGMADLLARQEQVAAQIAELQKTKAEIEAITASMPATILAQAQKHVAGAWDQLRGDSQKMIAETVGAETRRSVASLSEDIAAHARTLREQLANQGSEIAAELERKISVSLAQRQDQITRELQAVMEGHRAAAEAAVQKSAEEVVSGGLARAQQQIRESALADATRIASEHTASATAAADRLQQLHTAASAEAAALEKQAQLAREARDQLSAAAGEFSQQARTEAERHRTESEAVYEAARRRLEEVAQRSDQLLGETEAALLRSAEEIVSGEVARAQEQVRNFALPHVGSALETLRADAAKLVGDQAASATAAAERAEKAAEQLSSLQTAAAKETENIAARQADLAREMQDEVAKAAGEFSRHVQAESQRYASETAARLQQLQDAGDVQTDTLRKQLEQAQSWLGERTSEFRQSVHDAFLQAAGEIRGRVHSAVDTVDEIIQQKSKQVIAGIDSAGAQHAETIARSAESAQRDLETARANAAAAAEAELQKRLAETLEHFREDAARLAQSAAVRWQAAMEETLRSFPELLRARLDTPGHEPGS